MTINKKTYKVTSIGAKAFYKKSKLKTYRSMVRKAGFKGKNQKVKSL